MVDSLKIVTATNRKPADELADVRAKIKELKAREESLRGKLIAGTVSLTGDEYRVVISETKSEVIDSVKIKKEFGLQFLRPFLKQRETTVVKLKRLDGKPSDVEQ